VRFDRGQTKVPAVEQVLIDRDDALDELKFHWLRAQQRMKAQADKRRRDLEFSVGDLVFLKIRPYRQKSLAKRPNEKLAPRYYGPFAVLERIGKVAYKLDLPATTSIHPVFHISQLRPALGANLSKQSIPTQLTSELEFVVKPEALLGVRKRNTSTASVLDVLIKWQGLPDFEATWEKFDKIDHDFPAFHLADKVAFWDGGIDTPPVQYTYVRRKRRGGIPVI
jgi:hypothetical protein